MNYKHVEKVERNVLLTELIAAVKSKFQISRMIIIKS